MGGEGIKEKGAGAPDLKGSRFCITGEGWWLKNVSFQGT